MSHNTPVHLRLASTAWARRNWWATRSAWSVASCTSTRRSASAPCTCSCCVRRRSARSCSCRSITNGTSSEPRANDSAIDQRKRRRRRCWAQRTGSGMRLTDILMTVSRSQRQTDSQRQRIKLLRSRPTALNRRTWCIHKRGRATNGDAQCVFQEFSEVGHTTCAAG